VTFIYEDFKSDVSQVPDGCPGLLNWQLMNLKICTLKMMPFADKIGPRLLFRSPDHQKESITLVHWEAFWSSTDWNIALHENLSGTILSFPMMIRWSMTAYHLFFDVRGATIGTENGFDKYDPLKTNLRSINLQNILKIKYPDQGFSKRMMKKYKLCYSDIMGFISENESYIPL
jgi:hypothetical protein